jgi:tetratricopeptide (TPR) repeat protein
LLGSSALLIQEGHSQSADDWYESGRAALSANAPTQAVTAFQNAIELNPSAANWRWLGEANAKLERWDDATAAFDQSIKKYRALGDSVTARALENRTNPYRQQADVYVWNAGTWRDGNRARLEPSVGLMLGVYVDETGLSRAGTISSKLPSRVAVYFRYHQLLPQNRTTLNRPFFPTRFVQAVSDLGGAVHLALEPGVPLAQLNLSVFEEFARAVRDSRVPTFIRFASEFNDPNNEWSRNPALYRAQFRRFAQIMHRTAPNAAMVWMPMASRLEGIDAYYPGRDAVDWVGLSLYSTPFANGRLEENNLRVSPLDAIAPFYAKYAKFHPVQISEFASSHETLLTPGTDYTRFAVQKLNMLYWGAAMRFPRLKAINWLDIDMLRSRFVATERGPERRNNYALVPAKIEAFALILREPYFMKNPVLEPIQRPQALPDEVLADTALEISAWIKTYEPYPARVEYRLNKNVVLNSSKMPYRAKLPKLKPGVHRLEWRAFDSGGKLLLFRSKSFRAR